MRNTRKTYVLVAYVRRVHTTAISSLDLLFLDDIIPLVRPIQSWSPFCTPVLINASKHIRARTASGKNIICSTPCLPASALTICRFPQATMSQNILESSFKFRFSQDHFYSQRRLLPYFYPTLLLLERTHNEEGHVLL